MKFVIYREIESKRKILAEWDQEKIEDALEKKLKGSKTAFRQIIKEFKKESIKIP